MVTSMSTVFVSSRKIHVSEPGVVIQFAIPFPGIGSMLQNISCKAHLF